MKYLNIYARVGVCPFQLFDKKVPKSHLHIAVFIESRLILVSIAFSKKQKICNGQLSFLLTDQSEFDGILVVSLN